MSLVVDPVVEHLAEDKDDRGLKERDTSRRGPQPSRYVLRGARWYEMPLAPRDQWHRRDIYPGRLLPAKPYTHLPTDHVYPQMNFATTIEQCGVGQEASFAMRFLPKAEHLLPR